jgi:glucose/arabinose dehydrogenase
MPSVRTCLVIASALIAFVHSVARAELESPVSLSVELIPLVTTGLEHPLFLTHAGDGSQRLFLVEQAGRIRVVERGTLAPRPYLDISDRVQSGGEQGLLGLAFHPDYAHNGRFFVNYTRKPDGATVIAEYQRESRDAASREERQLLLVSQPYPNHNGGMVAFGPDGYLYIGLGDGGYKADPDNRAQNPDDLLGKILRIDVDHSQPYAIPAANPYSKGGGKPEVYAWGLRNPWRFSFDALTGDLWAADVGQYKWEEVDLVVRGGNYGWRVMEGRHCFRPPFFCDTSGLLPPVLEYGHEGGRCSITGGYVYRGKRHPALAGLYFYADFCSGELFGFQPCRDEQIGANPRVLLKTRMRISSFGVDEEGEVHLVDHNGAVHRILAR